MSQQLTVSTAIDSAEERFYTLAPAGMQFEAEKGFAGQLLKGNSYLMKVAKESPESLRDAIANVAAIGLSLNPAEKQAYLIPRNVKTNNGWKSQIFLEPSYIGLINLATSSGSVKWVQARTVYSNDRFTDNGVGDKPTHSYDAFSKDRGDFVGSYCVAKTPEGDFLTTIMTVDEIHDIRDRSEAWKRGQSGPWKSDPEEMSKKTVIRRAFKTWTRSGENLRMAEAVNISNENEGFEPLVSNPEIQPTTASQKQYFDKLIEDGEALGMAVLKHTTSISEFITLTNSFERGTKGKYQEMVKALLIGGEEILQSVRMDLIAATENNDPDGAKETWTDLTEDERKVVLMTLGSEVVLFIDSIEE